MMKSNVWLFALGLVVAGCNSNTPPGAPPPAVSKPQPAPSPHVPPAASHQPPDSHDRPYQGPPAYVFITQAKRLPPISEAIISVEIPSGGWTLELDKGEVHGDTAMIYLTLEKPGENEIVTQIAGTLQQRFTSDKPPFTKAHVYIHLAQRGVSTLTTDYRLAATGDLNSPHIQPPGLEPPKSSAHDIVVNEDDKYEGPPVRVRRLQLQSEPPQQVVNIEVTNNTGGWTLQIDKAEVAEGVARIYMTLTRPAPDDVVTQAITTLSQSYTTDRPLHTARVYVNFTQRGVEQASRDYRLAAED
jgi:hypothetical protein